MVACAVGDTSLQMIVFRPDCSLLGLQRSCFRTPCTASAAASAASAAAAAAAAAAAGDTYPEEYRQEILQKVQPPGTQGSSQFGQETVKFSIRVMTLSWLGV